MNDLSRNASTESMKSTPEFRTDVVQTVNREDSNHQNHGSGVETGQVVKNTTDSTKSADCKCGKKYVEELEEVVKQLLHCSDIPGADQLILEFSSKFCSGDSILFIHQFVINCFHLERLLTWFLL